jgi:hypothetical protein
VWFGERWITSVFDLFKENVQYFPALLPICEDEDPLAALDRGVCPQLAEMSLHNGTIYRWNRPIYAVVDGKPHLRVENRVLPAGPSVATLWRTRHSATGSCVLSPRRSARSGHRCHLLRRPRTFTRRRALRHGRATLLAGLRRSAGGRARTPPPADAGTRGTARLGRQPPPASCSPRGSLRKNSATCSPWPDATRPGRRSAAGCSRPATGAPAPTCPR